MMRVVLLALVSCLGSSALFGALKYFTSKADPVAPPVRVAVLKRDHPDGAPLAADELGEALVPGDLVSPAWLTPEAAAAQVGKPCLAESAGAALTASHFADLTTSARAAACVEAIAPEVDAAADAEVEKVLSAVQRRDAPVRDVPRGKVLFLTRALREGEVLKASDLREGDAPPEVLTASWVSAERRAEVVGQQVASPIEAGEPLWWQMLNEPGTPQSCEFEVTRAVARVRTQVSARAAAAWVEKESASW